MKIEKKESCKGLVTFLLIGDSVTSRLLFDWKTLRGGWTEEEVKGRDRDRDRERDIDRDRGSER